MVEGGETDPWPILRSLPFGTRVALTHAGGHRWIGTLLPSHELSGERILTLKLESGYNVGVRVESDLRYEILGQPLTRSVPGWSAPPTMRPPGPERVELLTTGGTIASRVDYETGGVAPVKDEREILAFYPELAASADVRIVPVLDRLSENLVPADWLLLAEKTVESFARGARGVVIAHGTDTLGFSAAALSFLLRDLPGPVVLVGAQRSPDRPSSDGPSNLAAAVEVARSAALGEVAVVMHASMSDGRFAIHRGSWVRKMHSSRRDAFETRNGEPLGHLDAEGIRLAPHARPPARGPPRVDGPLDTRAGLLWSYPGLSPERAGQFAQGLRGVVLAGTGLGHIGVDHLGWIRDAVRSGTVVAMTTQCLEGTVDPYVYATGRDLLDAGVLYLNDLLPETAYTKMCWALGHATASEAVRTLLLQDRAGEFLDRRRAEPPA
jgi:glutamyl-tRNA(Gln) amidotransferase subunit D